jgi:hypothetical protein
VPVKPEPGATTYPVQDYGGATSNSASANRNRDHVKGAIKTAAGYLVTSDLTQDASINEAELRAIEVLLGGDLKTLIARDLESLKTGEFKR